MKSLLQMFCQDIGCSGMQKKCPGNPDCAILRKIAYAIKEHKGGD